MQVIQKLTLACNLPGLSFTSNCAGTGTTQLQQCTSSKVKIKPLRFKPAWVSNKIPSATKLSIVDNIAPVETTAEKELFHQLYQEYTVRRTMNWTCLLNKYNTAAARSYAQGSCEICWKTLPLLKHYEISCVNLSSIARSR